MNNQEKLVLNKDYYIESMLKALFILMALLPIRKTIYGTICIIVGASASIYGLQRQCGKIQLKNEYLFQALQKEYGQSLFYLFIVIAIKQTTVLFLFPIVVQYMLGIVQLLKYTDIRYLQNKFTNELSQKILAKSNEVKLLKFYMEIILFFYSIFAIRQLSFTLPIALGFFLKLKIKFFPQYKQEVDKMQTKVLQVIQKNINNPKVLEIANKIFNKIKSE